MFPLPMDDQNRIDRQITAVVGSGSTDLWFVGYDGLRYHYDGQTLKKYAYPK